MKKLKKIIPGLIIAFILFLAVGYAAGIKINTSESWPRGLYYSKKIDKSLDQYRNKFILVCPDPDNPVIRRAKNWHILEPGFQCPGEIAPFLKKLVGLPGDTIAIDKSGVEINGQSIKNSRIKYKVFELVIHPGYKRTLKPGEYWVMSDYSPNSLDSRYFGTVKRSAIIRASKPLFLIEK